MADGQSFFDEVKDMLSFKGFADQLEIAADNLEKYATQLNKTFGQTKERLGEMMTTIAASTPKITRLGGDVQDVFNTLDGISRATRRNIVASDENVTRLYATSQVLGDSVEEIVNHFADIGVTFASIPDQIEESVNYVRSIGANTNEVMRQVTFNMDRLNRFQFENGVVGLTKMAAQASLLRFNMYQTFQLADKVISPEGAIEVAAAFQRLGVTAGNLVDPFQLMNQSINDPQGLQDSIINVAKQFSYFDDQTKTFKINPQGVLMLREIETQTGISAAELSKAAVSAQDLERKLSQINKIGLNFSEEDKLYLANITQMTKEGQYTVNLRTEFGKMITKPLEEVTKEELDKLLEEQKSGGKTMEDVARAQLTTLETIRNDVRSMYRSMTYGATGASVVADISAGASRVLTSTFGGLSEGVIESMEGKIDGAITSLLGAAKNIYKSGDLSLDTLIKEIEKIEGKFDVFTEGTMDKITNSLSEQLSKGTKITELEKFIQTNVKDLLQGSLSNKSLIKEIESIEGQLSPYEKKLMGSQSLKTQGNVLTNQNIKDITTSVSGKVDVNGNVNVNIKLPSDFSTLNTEQLKTVFNTLVNSEDFKSQIDTLIRQHYNSLQKSGNK